MRLRYIATGLLGSALLASVAFAEEPATTAANPGDTTKIVASDSSSQGDWRASKIVGLRVYNDKNESVGAINDLLTDKSGNIKAVVIGVGGFLGMGEHLVAIAFDKVKFVNEPIVTAVDSTMPPAPAGTRPPSTTTVGNAGAGMAPSTSTTSTAKQWYPDHAVFNATKDELKAMPEFKYSS
jgi:sporulation protein YlmC with PRC-barrel domain